MAEEILKTGYEWSLEANHRILDLTKYQIQYGEKGIAGEGVYFEEMVSKFNYLEALGRCEIKENSIPRKTEMYLEYRLYGLVPYNISPIQAGIQFGHACVEYGQRAKDFKNLEKIYDKWANNDKTFIILNGGTTNENKDSKFYGSMQKNWDLLIENDILIAEFREPDLNDTLTAIVFLVSELVWNRELYPDYVNIPYPWNGRRGYKPSDKEMEKWEAENNKNREAWVVKIGGVKNDWLRTFLKNFKLAN